MILDCVGVEHYADDVCGEESTASAPGSSTKQEKIIGNLEQDCFNVPL